MGGAHVMDARVRRGCGEGRDCVRETESGERRIGVCTHRLWCCVEEIGRKDVRVWLREPLGCRYIDG